MKKQQVAAVPKAMVLLSSSELEGDTRLRAANFFTGKSTASKMGDASTESQLPRKKSIVILHPNRCRGAS
jgi:hypothetical protein